MVIKDMSSTNDGLYNKKSYNILLLIIIVIILLALNIISCGGETDSDVSLFRKENIRYFRKLVHYPKNNYREISSKFEDEIKTEEELKQTEKQNQPYYEVHIIGGDTITKYLYYNEEGVCTLTAEYFYETDEYGRIGKLLRIEYYDFDNRLMAIDKIEYNERGEKVKGSRLDKNREEKFIF